MPQYQLVQASETQDNTIDSNEEWVDVLDMLQEDIKKNIEEQQEQQKQQEEEAKKQEEATAKISPLLINPAIKSKFVFQNRIDDKVLVYRYNGTRQELEEAGAEFQHFNYSNLQIATVKGGYVNYTKRMAYFIDSDIIDGMPVIGGSVSLSNDKMYAVSPYGELSENKLNHTQNPKYKDMVKEIFNKISGDVLYPRSYYYRADWVLTDNYKLLMEPKYRDFLAKLAVKYKICDNSETTSMKAKLAISVFYDVYNASDNLVNYDTDDNARISRIEFYTLFCKYFYGSKAVIAEYQSGYPNEKDFMKNFENKDYAPFYDYAYSSNRSIMPGFITTKKVLAADITKFEVMSLIYATNELKYSNEEEYNKYKKKSILDYCSDIKKSQIMTYNTVCNKYYGGESTGANDIYDVCMKNKIIMDYDQAGLIYLIDIGVLTVDSKNRLNLFNKVTYNQAITYLMNYSANRK
jgi:hypothetical protein